VEGLRVPMLVETKFAGYHWGQALKVKTHPGREGVEKHLAALTLTLKKSRATKQDREWGT
jgi:hypothetical protein